MFPPPLADLTFHDDAAGSPTALAARLAAATTERPVLLLGADRAELVTAVARQARQAVVIDSSRGTLRRARAALALEGGDTEVTFLAADPRDMQIPGGVRAALVPNLVWRALSTEPERREMLECLRQELAPSGVLCLDLEALPATLPAELPARDGAPALVVEAFDPGRVAVRAVAAEALPAPLLLAAQTPAEALAEVERSGFAPEQVVDAATGRPPQAGTRRVWIVARAESV